MLFSLMPKWNLPLDSKLVIPMSRQDTKDKEKFVSLASLLLINSKRLFSKIEVGKISKIKMIFAFWSLHLIPETNTTKDGVQAAERV